MGKQKTHDFTNNTIIWNIPYHPGNVTAKGFIQGKEVASYSIETSKETKYLTLTPDRQTIKADGQDLSHITVQLYDEDGKPVQTDDKHLKVSIEGEGKLMGVDNGDLRKRETFSSNKSKTYFGKALIIVQSRRKAGKIKINVQMEDSETPYTLTIQTH